MKNISSVKTNYKTESPKTPGGISKSLLTPCRRVGLSRNWRKSGSSPFISPLSGVTPTTEQKVETEKRKRKKCLDEDEDNKETVEVEKGEDISENDTSPIVSSDINKTPSRVTVLRKKSKTLMLARECPDEIESEPQSSSEVISGEQNDNSTSQRPAVCLLDSTSNEKISNLDNALPKNKSKNKSPRVLKLSRNKSVSKSETLIPKQIPDNIVETSIKQNSDKIAIEKIEDHKNEKREMSKDKSPNNLTKECMVVIQKKIFKTTCSDTLKPNDQSTKLTKPGSQTLFDSDSDDVPLCNINKQVKEPQKPTTNILKVEENDDFAETKKPVKKLQDKTTSISGLKSSSSKGKHKLSLKKKMPVKSVVTTPSSQSSYSFDDESDDDNDFKIDKKKTIIIKKSYDKTIKPIKAKSTGSITQRDIDEIKSRIEVKKKLLLAKAMTGETEELRGLIKKWQKGCQNALTELLDLMKSKMPDHRNMEYSEILQTLKIPLDLVGFDSENDCFITPDDATIVLSEYNVK